MADLCRSLGRYFDGELSAPELEGFREHLAGCEKCGRELEELLQLDALGVRHLQLQPTRLYPAKLQPERRPWYWWAIFASPALAAALAVVVYVQVTSVPDSLWSPGGPDVRLAEARSSYPRAAQYRKLEERHLGGPGESRSLPLRELAKLEGDRLALASAYLARAKPELVQPALDALGSDASPDLDAERAMAYLIRGDAGRADYEDALHFAERALEKDPRHGPALWNKALVLEKLELFLLSARTFDEVAQLGEPGWATEARERAERLRRQAASTLKDWNEAREAGERLLVSGSSLPPAAMGAPLSRSYFYDAVRTRTSAQDVEPLLPLAEQLDPRGTHLREYVKWVAAQDFKVRAPLATEYRRLVSGQASAESVLRQLKTSNQHDLVVGALMWSQKPLGADELQELERRAQALKDPWFRALALEQQALALELGDPRQSRQLLEQAIQMASAAGLEYRVLAASLQLVNLLLRTAELEAARARAFEAWNVAGRGGAWDIQLRLIEELGQLARLRFDDSVGKAYLEEAVERTREDRDKAHERFNRIQLASLALGNGQVELARKQLDAAIATGLPLTITGASVLADVARVRPSAVDRQAIDQFRAGSPRMSPIERALATSVIGRWTIEVNLEEGRRLLRDAIAQAGTPEDPDGDAGRARFKAYSSLIMDAAKQGDFAGVLALFGEEARAPFPATCALAMSVDIERGVAVVRGASGAVEGVYDGARAVVIPERLDGFVPPKLVNALAGCPEVKVVARSPIYGKLGALPASLPWSYVLLARGPSPEGAPGAERERHLVVQSVALAAARKRLDLDVPEPWIRASPPREEISVLEGAAATPSRVLAEMRQASDVDIVTHSLVDPFSREAYLVLAEGPEGDALRATRIRGNPLPRRPIVTLSACNAARSAPVLHQPRSLPAALLLAGARAVLAADEKVPQREGPEFFDAVRARIREGVAPAVALRDVRQSWLAQKKGMNWVESVMLFE